MSLTLVGVLASDPRRWSSGETTVRVATPGQVVVVSVSSTHAAWVARTCRAGMLVEVQGVYVTSGLIHARQVWPVMAPAD
jgi:hypothetical protein